MQVELDKNQQPDQEEATCLSGKNYQSRCKDDQHLGKEVFREFRTSRNYYSLKEAAGFRVLFNLQLSRFELGV